MYPASAWSAFELRAIMDISARAISLADRPRTSRSGHQCSHAPGRPILHSRLDLSQTSAGKAMSTASITLDLMPAAVELVPCPWQRARAESRSDANAETRLSLRLFP